MTIDPIGDGLNPTFELTIRKKSDGYECLGGWKGCKCRVAGDTITGAIQNWIDTSLREFYDRRSKSEFADEKLALDVCIGYACRLQDDCP